MVQDTYKQRLPHVIHASLDVHDNAELEEMNEQVHTLVYNQITHMEVLRKLINPLEAFFDGLLVFLALQDPCKCRPCRHLLELDGFSNKFPTRN
jgi:hypothetical protein